MTDMEIIIDRDVKLCRLQVGDARALAHHANDPLVVRFLRDFFPHPYTMDDALGFIEAAQKCGLAQLAIKVNQEAAGVIGLVPGRDIEAGQAELGYWLGRGYWGRGIMTRVVREYVSQVFSHTDFHRIFAIPFARNRASIAVLEKCGFMLEGILRQCFVKQGRKSDGALYSILKDKVR